MKKIAITIENSFVLLVAEDVMIYVYTKPNTSVLLLSWKILENEDRRRMRVDKVKVFSSPVVCLCTFNDQSLIVLALTIPQKCNRKDTSTPTGQIIAVNANSYYENVKTLLKK